MSKRSKHNEMKTGAPPWMSTYGDLVTLLLCFFVLLFSMSSLDVAKFKAAISSFTEQIDILHEGDAITDGEILSNGISQLNGIQVALDNKIPLEDGKEDVEFDREKTSTKKDAETIKEYLTEAGYEKVVKIEYNSNIVKLTIEGELLFDSGRAELKQEAYSLIDIVSKILLEQDLTNKTIQIEGHTDNLNINTVRFPSNWELSQARAIAVGYVFIDKYNIDPSKIAATGYGEYRPIDNNSTPEGRAKNRRVEIKIVNEEYISTEELQDISG